MKTPHANRRQAQRPKLKGGYCWCDSWMMTKGAKCPICGNGLEQTKRLKKPAPTIEEFDYEG